MSDNIDWLNRLAKWRSVFAGWQLGTRLADDPECQAVRDHREATLLQQLGTEAITTLLIRKGIFTAEELTKVLHEEAALKCSLLEVRFPGFRSTDAGMEMDRRAFETTKGWKP